MDKWDKRFLRLASHISNWSKDSSTKCGAVIVKDKKIIATGYNGFPKNIDDNDRLNIRTIKYKFIIHAEINALIQAKYDVDGCTIYVAPMCPCVRCAVQLIQSGISRVVTMKLPDVLINRWGKSVKDSKEIFKESGIEYGEF
jgi:dCMP deaminase